MFNQIVSDLMSAGLNQKAIGDAVGTSQATISRLLAGQESLDWRVADALRLLHATHCPQNECSEGDAKVRA